MIIITILVEIMILVGACIFAYLADDRYELGWGILSGILWIALLIVPFAIGGLHGYIDYKSSSDKDLARITSVTQEQDAFKTYYKVEVEYLTNTPTQEGMIQNKNIEKDRFYCYYEDKELVNKLKDNMYKELWIISGRKGGYENFKDFGTQLIKDIELKED